MSLNNENLEIVKSTKLLGLIMSENLKWDENTNFLVKKAYKRMELLRKGAHFTVSKEEKRNIYVLYIRSILEQSCVVWHSSLTQDNENDLERVQKAAVKVILGKEYPENYEQALVRADLDTLKERRTKLCKEFAKKCLQNEKTEGIFKRNSTKYKIKTKKIIFTKSNMQIPQDFKIQQ